MSLLMLSYGKPSNKITMIRLLVRFDFCFFFLSIILFLCHIRIKWQYSMPWYTIYLIRIFPQFHLISHLNSSTCSYYECVCACMAMSYYDIRNERGKKPTDIIVLKKRCSVRQTAFSTLQKNTTESWLCATEVYAKFNNAKVEIKNENKNCRCNGALRDAFTVQYKV